MEKESTKNTDKITILNELSEYLRKHNMERFYFILPVVRELDLLDELRTTLSNRCEDRLVKNRFNNYILQRTNSLVLLLAPEADNGKKFDIPPELAE